MKLGLLIRNVLAQFAWYRKKQPGHWELWRLPGSRGTAWLRASGCFFVRGHGPDSRLKGIPLKCEHHWPDSCEYLEIYEVARLPEGMRCPVCRNEFATHPKDPCYVNGNRPPLYRVCTGQLVQVVAKSEFHSILKNSKIHVYDRPNHQAGYGPAKWPEAGDQTGGTEGSGI